MSASRRDFLAWLPAALLALLSWRPRPAPAAAVSLPPARPRVTSTTDPWDVSRVVTSTYDADGNWLSTTPAGWGSPSTSDLGPRPPLGSQGEDSPPSAGGPAAPPA
jgi:hypothetical protein